VGDVETGFEKADYIREDHFFCGGQAHMCMETRAAVSSYTSRQEADHLEFEPVSLLYAGLMAGVLGMREGDIRVIAQYVGGGFGGKFELDGAISFRNPQHQDQQARKGHLFQRRGFHCFKTSDPHALLGQDGVSKACPNPARESTRLSAMKSSSLE